MSLSLFDVVGPVMHGPSSNHTGGANRIGFFARQVFGETPTEITLYFHPAFMQAYAGQKSHVALLAGCLGLRESDEESNRSVCLCRERGILWQVKAVDDPSLSRNTMCVAGKTEEGDFIVDGDSIGGGNIIINGINGVRVHLDGTTYSAIIIADVPELIDCIRSCLSTDGKDVDLESYEGITKEGKVLCCIQRRIPFPDVNELPEIARNAIDDNQIIYRAIPTISPFVEKNPNLLFSTFHELEETANQKGFPEAAIEYESSRSGVDEKAIYNEIGFMHSVITKSLSEAEKGSFELIGSFTNKRDGKALLDRAQNGNTILDPGFTLCLARAVLLSQMNASSCRIVAAPTAGSAGTLPAVLLTSAEKLGRSKEELLNAFLVSAAVGVVIGNRASFSGTVGGCQSEIGVASAMGAAGIAWLMGGTPHQVIHSAAIALKNMLGLTCDAPASPVEVPCIKRNAMGAAVAFFGAEMGMAGIESAIEPDDVVDALFDTQKRMPMELKASYIGGLAGTKSGKEIHSKWNDKLKALSAEDTKANS